MSLEPKQIRACYDRVASRYATAHFRELDGKPLDRALLSVFADDVAQAGGGLIADLGAGPGQVGGFLRDLDAEVVSVDLSPAMGRIAHDELGLRAVTGSLTDLPVAPDGLAGAVAFYCLIHLDEDGLRRAADELARVIRPGGPIMAAFHVGEDVRHLDEWWDEEVDVDFRFLPTRTVVDELERVGFVTEAVLERASYPHEVDTRRAYVLARRPKPRL